MLTPSCAIWCDNTRLSEELIECSIGSFIDLQAALQRSIHTLHLAGKSLHDDLVKMKVFVRQGVTCFSGATFDCTSSFENWQTVLKEEGRRIYLGRNPDTVIFHRVHKARNRREQLSSRSSHHDLSSLALVIGPRLPGCGIYWTCVEAREGGSFITTTSCSDIREFRFTRGISLPVMSDVIAPPFYWRIIRLLILPKGVGLLPLCKYRVKRQDLPRRCPQ